MSTKTSRTHALIKLEGSDLILTDLGSKNGTMVNEYPLEVNKAHLLENGDRLRFGDQTFQLMSGS
jgi:pSer/pThr/pTyr-binding forkhead associated (FHA) protein